MPKTIKLDDEVYRRLDALRMKGMTFSETVDQLIAIKVLVGTLTSQVTRTGDLSGVQRLIKTTAE